MGSGRDGDKAAPAPALPLETLLALGLDQRTAENALVNSKVTANLAAVIAESGIKECDKSVGNLLYAVATKYPTNALVHRPVLIKYVLSTKIKNPAQLDAALLFLTNTGPDSLDVEKFEEACGVGVVVSIEEIKSTVTDVLEENMEAIKEQRYHINVGTLCGHVRKRHPWGDAKAIKEEIDKRLAEILGPKTEADNIKPVKKKKEKPAKVEEKKVVVATSAPPSEEELNPYTIFPQPDENFKVHTEIFYSNGNIWRAHNTKEILEKHLKETGGKVMTRFPPEPNGYLHIGHAKAMFIDFGLAKERNGHCYLRSWKFMLVLFMQHLFTPTLLFDDTNPEAEKKEYIDHIQEIVHWMGWEPYKVTYTSDYFQALYEHAVELIRKGLAYVDHQTAEEIKEYREKKMNSPWRGRPVEESLKLFEDMRRGLIAEGAATLRMKQDMQNENKNISHLIHTLVISGVSIQATTMLIAWWILLKTSHIRLNISNAVMSKRKLNRLVTEKWVDGWDDPRLLTLAGLRRRGVSSTAINSFIRGIGITRSDNSLIRVDRLEYHIREELNKTAPRTMVVLRPLKVVITNLEEGKVLDLDGKMWPDASDTDASSHYKVPFSRTVYIEKTDFRLKDSKDYYGLAPGKSVMLRYAFPIKCTDVIYGDSPDDIVEIRAEYDPLKTSKLKGVLHWVAEPTPGVEPLKVEVRLFEKLFMSEDWLGDLNPHSKEVIKDAYAVPSVATAVLGDKFQFERLGYFAVDTDSTPEKLVFNRTVTLRDSFGKAGPK
ncbi:Glutamine--tRNA ligase [Dichanthelium oligosanthes]|uniref:glutamine--tRNA ligase n=1 Tax=Dichanthelium oligosanthes TaxID=888268 RepID=A0A1E5VK25_9POAL|nr:Glutamine--tRNA ligase [Dichanthelium oligosanthes]